MYPFRECREKAGYTQKYVALSLHVKPPSVSDWENGNTCPTIDNLIKMADLYGVTVDELLGRAGAKRKLRKDESEILDAYRKASPAIKEGVQKLLDISAPAEKSIIQSAT